MEKLQGKTIEKIEFPKTFVQKEGLEYSDDNIKITFTDGTVLELASWDYEGYNSGIFKRINGEDVD